MELREHAIDAARERELDARAVDRLVFFSDAVIAIIITLMVLEVRLPVLPEHVGEAEVLRAILALWPKYLAVVLSYLVIGLFWTLHHRRFNWVRRVDATLVWLNLLYLLAIACVPFATSLTAEHVHHRIRRRIGVGDDDLGAAVAARRPTSGDHGKRDGQPRDAPCHPDVGGQRRRVCRLDRCGVLELEPGAVLLGAGVLRQPGGALRL